MFFKSLNLLSVFLFLGFAAFADQFQEPVDIVYLWVDGNDPAWQAIKSEWSAYHAQSGIEMKADAFAKNRYSDHEELKYSLRSVWLYASFVNHIYIVTMNQKPSWLKDHPQITIIDHKDIFDDLADLPTFNSMAIECHLHRIPNLSEHFIYFNDDMFLGRKVNPSDFFSSSGKIKVSFEKDQWAPSGPAKKQDVTYWAANKNTNNLLNQRFKNEKRLLISHAPYALSKLSMEGTAKLFSEEFANTSSHRFRCFQDFTITNGLLQYHWNYQNKVEKSKLSNMMVYFFDDSKSKSTIKNLNDLQKMKPHTFCLQDKAHGDDAKTKEILKNFLENWYSEKAPWEN